MTAQEKKAALRRYREAESEIDSLLLERERWQARALRITPCLSGMPRAGGNGRALESAAVQVASIEAEIDRAVARAQEDRARIRAAIDRVPDSRMRDVLRYRYLDGLIFETIADRMHYSLRQVYSLHGYALDALELPWEAGVQ